MAKRPLKLTLRIPPYRSPRNAWRKQLHQVVLRHQRKSPVTYKPDDKLELEIRLYLAGAALSMHDVGNRLKDIMDALQGRAGGAKNKKSLTPIITNDSQVYRVIVEKSAPPKQSHGLSHLTIRKYRAWKFVRYFPGER